ncbi:hypothetical protein C2857_000328 [Epichloe festucae Fl1]|uniref:Translation machinery associated TMA7 n=1 Tax=Epichloe festucae (strain Fl1) TaxID=877507 RepID=A0A7S9KR94_EPIFF|nr:hypothetical protein C2857_000328 [Epichloe festucae Fl1]
MGGQSRQGGTRKPERGTKSKPKGPEDPEDEALRLKVAADKKAEKEMAAQISGKKGPLNTGSQGIKKSGKK